jgi:AMMECR1 domain-containing protein
MNQRKWERIEFVRMHLITTGFMPNYTIWSMHGEVGVNVSRGNNDGMAMPDVALHEAVTNEEPMATINNVFMNTLVDDTEYNDGIFQLVRNVESGFLSDR